MLAEADGVAVGKEADGNGGWASAVAASTIEQTHRGNVFIFILW
jgi:hypothetical protein